MRRSSPASYRTDGDGLTISGWCSWCAAYRLLGRAVGPSALNRNRSIRNIPSTEGSRFVLFACNGIELIISLSASPQSSSRLPYRHHQEYTFNWTNQKQNEGKITCHSSKNTGSAEIKSMDMQLLKFSPGLDSVSLELPHSSRKRPVGRCCRQRKSLIVLPLLLFSLLWRSKENRNSVS